MSTVIDQLIDQAEITRRAQVEAEEARNNQFLDAVEAAIAETLGKLWPVLKAYAQIERYDTRLVSARCIVNPSSDLELMSFYIHYQRGHVFLSQSEIAYPPSDDGHIGAFLADCRQAYYEHAREAHQKAFYAAKLKLSGYGAKTEDEADAALAELLTLEPDDAEKWNTLRAVWQTWYDEQQAYASRQVQLKALASEYEAAYRAWWLAYLGRIELDRAALADLQNELDNPFHFYELTYGLVANAEDGASYVDTNHHVYVTADQPGDDGYWLVYDRGKLARRRFYHPISVEGPLASRPTDDPYYVRGQIEVRGHYHDVHIGCIYFNPAVVTRNEVTDMANLLIKRYPTPPKPPADLNPGDVCRIQYEVTEQR